MERLPIRTTVLALVGLVLLGQFCWKRTHKPIRSGVNILLVHKCGWNEAFNLLGDDRQVVARYLPNNAAFINEKPETPASLVKEVSLIMESRNEKILWVLADYSLSYGDVAEHIAAIKSNTPKLNVLIASEAQIEDVNAQWQRVAQNKNPSTTEIYSNCPNPKDMVR